MILTFLKVKDLDLDPSQSSNVIILQMMTDRTNFAVAIEYQVPYVLSIGTFTFDLGSFKRSR